MRKIFGTKCIKLVTFFILQTFTSANADADALTKDVIVSVYQRCLNLVKIRCKIHVLSI